jgi:hypothetical protein
MHFARGLTFGMLAVCFPSLVRADGDGAVGADGRDARLRSTPTDSCVAAFRGWKRTLTKPDGFCRKMRERSSQEMRRRPERGF